MVRYLEKRMSCMRLSATMRRFSEVIDELHLKDLPLFDGKYTWSGGSNNSLAFKLNYFLVFDDWEGQFNGLVQKIMANPVFDHTPIMLDGGGIRNGKVPFSFENMWLKVKGFKDLIRN